MVKKYFIFLLFSFSFSQLLDKIDSNAYKSLLIPGYGEYSLNQKSKSKKFFIAEAILWTSFLISSNGSNWYENNYMTFGSFHSGIDLNSVPSYKLSKLIVHMSQYDNMEEFNETMDRQRRDNTYSNSTIYGWDWDSDTNRNKFNKLRVKNSNLKKAKNFTISALLINRLISFFNVIYLSDKDYELSSNFETIDKNTFIFNFNINF
tara:strand:+ start:5962 stop:6576 length:615 start_codon:yes stop_codon:yes gene_type:complete